MTATKKVTYQDAFLNGTHTEIYRCGRALNDRGKIHIYIFKGSRWDSRTRKKVTAKELMDDGWILTHRMEWYGK